MSALLMFQLNYFHMLGSCRMGANRLMIIIMRMRTSKHVQPIYVTGFAKRGLIRAFINTEKSRFEILITVYLDNA